MQTFTKKRPSSPLLPVFKASYVTSQIVGTTNKCSWLFLGGILPERVNAMYSVDLDTKHWRFPAQSIASWKGKLRNMMTDTVVAFPSQTLGKNVQQTAIQEDGAIQLGQR